MPTSTSVAVKAEEREVGEGPGHPEDPVEPRRISGPRSMRPLEVRSTPSRAAARRWRASTPGTSALVRQACRDRAAAAGPGLGHPRRDDGGRLARSRSACISARVTAAP